LSNEHNEPAIQPASQPASYNPFITPFQTIVSDESGTGAEVSQQSKSIQWFNLF